MFRSSLKLGEIMGIPFLINYTWFIIFLIVTVSLSLYYFPDSYPQWSAATSWTVGVVTSLLFFASVLAHELSHSMVAIAKGIPVKSITLFIFGGVARISKEAATPPAELMMAAAGPASSVAIGLFFALVWYLTRNIVEPVAALAEYLMYINFMLAAFNMIPGFPLDGGRVFRAVIWWTTQNYRKATRIASVAGQVVAYLFIFGGILIVFLTGQWFTGLWLAFIGWFLESAASNSYRQMMLREALHGFKASDLMSSDCVQVPRSLSIGRLVNEHILNTGRRCFFVADGEQLRGMVTLRDVKKVPQAQWETTTLGEVMTPAGSIKAVGINDPAVSVLEQMDENDINQVPVVEGGRVVGMIARDSLLRFIRTRSELGM